MKERPILFSAPMVRAILDGKKTQTRRVVKPQPWTSCTIEDGTPRDKTPFVYSALDGHGPGYDVHESRTPCKCPYGQPGDQLWVRETFQPLHVEGVDQKDTNWNTGRGYDISYPATDGIREYIDCDDNLSCACKPSIHMPRWASRINLLIKSIRVERLNEISEDDAKAEGVEPFFSTHQSIGRDQTMTTGERISDCEHRASFACLWDDIHGDNSWQQNPWVWVVEFEVMK